MQNYVLCCVGLGWIRLDWIEKTRYLCLFNQMIPPFQFSSSMFLQKSLKCSVTAISLSYDICCDFRNWQHFTIVGNFLYAKIKSDE